MEDAMVKFKVASGAVVKDGKVIRHKGYVVLPRLQ